MTQKLETKTVDLESTDDRDKKLVANGKTHNMTKGELQRATDDVMRELAKAILLDDAEMECDDIDETYHSDIVDAVFRDCEEDFWQWCIQAGCPIHRAGIEGVVAQTYWKWSEAIEECEDLWIMDDDDDDDDDDE